ncbi:hypothetical protein [Maribacter polysiphoniae]|nr:hypothetical protein [Maribacter polysiphoniae]
MGKDLKNVVITPDSYSKKGKGYSEVYLLQGAGGDHKDWLKKSPEY